jgi:hypothetical protein
MYRLKHKDFNFRLDETTVNNKHIINNLNSYYNNSLFSNLPDNIIDITMSFNNELIGDINEFEKTYKIVRNEFNSVIYSNTIYNYCKSDIHNVLDASDNACFYGFLAYRLKPFLPDGDEDDEPDDVYDRVMECLISGNISHEDLQCLFLKFDKTVLELITIFEKSILDYFDMFIKYHLNKTIFVSNSYYYPNNEPPGAFYYCVEDCDTLDEVSGIEDERADFWISYHKECVKNGMFKKYYN